MAEREAGRMRKIAMMMLLLLLPLGMIQGEGNENRLRYVFPVDPLTLEVVMEKPLTEEETDPLRVISPDFQSDFTFSDGLVLIGMPVLQPYDGMAENTYRIAVSGLKEGNLYTISYKGQKPKTFKAYPRSEMQDKYRNRYGSYF